MTLAFNLPRYSALFIAAMSCVGIAGCGSLLGPSNPPEQIYRLGAQASPQQPGATVSWQLAIARPDTNRTLDTNRIALLRGSLLDYYANAQWNDTAPRLVQSLLVQAFDRSGRVQAATTDSILRADLTLTTELRDFEAQYDGANAAPMVVIDLQAKLLDPRGQVVASLDSRQTARATQDSVVSVVDAFNQAMAAAVAQIVGWTLQATPH